MTERLNIGVAGCGSIARAVHLPLLRRREDVSLVAVADSDAAARSAAVSLSGARAFSSVEEMVAECRLDAVIVALPTAAHASAARAVFDAGCDLYLEKPLAADLRAGLGIVDAWRDRGRIGMMGFNARFNPLILALKRALDEGRAGTPVYVRSVFATAPGEAPTWRRRRASGGGALLELGVHHIDLVRFLFGEATAVAATVTSRDGEDDTALLELELDHGPRVHGFYSLAASEGDRMEVFGDRARLSVSRFTSLDVAVIDNPGGAGAVGRMMGRVAALRHLGRALRARRSPLREPGYAAALDCFLTGVRTRRLPPEAPTPADGLACLAVVDAAERASRSRRVEAVSVSPPSGHAP